MSDPHKYIPPNENTITTAGAAPSSSASSGPSKEKLDSLRADSDDLSRWVNARALNGDIRDLFDLLDAKDAEIAKIKAAAPPDHPTRPGSANDAAYRAAWEKMNLVRERADKLLGTKYLGWNWVHALVDMLEKMPDHPTSAGLLELINRREIHASHDDDLRTYPKSANRHDFWEGFHYAFKQVREVLAAAPSAPREATVSADSVPATKVRELIATLESELGSNENEYEAGRSAGIQAAISWTESLLPPNPQPAIGEEGK